MDSIQALILGLVQGLTEYLPVSSSAHLVLVPKILGWDFEPEQAFIFDVLVQMGTLLGVIVYFFSDLRAMAYTMWKDLRIGKPFQNPESRLGWLVGFATIPAAFGGLFLKDSVEAYFNSTQAVLFFLLITAVLLVLAEFFNYFLKKTEEIKFKTALAMGIAQVIALFPGISRSGSTIAAGMVLGATKSAAARFSFLMSIPIMVGAGLIASKELMHQPEVLESMWKPVLIGFLTATFSGYWVIYWFLNFLKSQSLLWFALYCALVGGVGLFLV